MKKPQVVYVEGLPGAGKTTLLTTMTARVPGITVVGEYVEPTEAEAAIAVDDERYFLRNDERKYRAARAGGGLCLVDRGHVSTILYNEGHQLVTGTLPVDVHGWYRDTIQANGMLPDAYVHLDSDPTTTFARRPPTTEWDNMWDRLEVLEHARDGYRRYMAEEGVPVLRLTADRMTIADVGGAVMEFLQVEPGAAQ